MKTQALSVDLSLLQRAVRRSRADETAIVCLRSRRVTSRFANGRAHQNLAQDDVTIWAKAQLGQRAGVSVTNALDARAIDRSIQTATAIARLAPPDPRSAPMPHRHPARTLRAAYAAATAPELSSAPSELRSSEEERVVSCPRLVSSIGIPARGLPRLATATAAFGTDERFRLIASLLAAAARHHCDLSGSLMTETTTLAVVNSHGVARHHQSTVAALKTIALRGQASGFAASIAADVRRLAPDATLDRALGKCLTGRSPIALPPGTYDVILEPEAVGDLVTWLGYIGFGAKSFYEKTGFLYGRIGERIMHRRVTIEDDPFHPDGLPMPFDYEGVAKRKVPLIEAGVARGVVFDSAYARLYHRDSTGHAMPPDETEGPLPLHLTVAPATSPQAGETTLEEMIQSVSRGILVTRFHYVNGLLKPRAALMTGLTRDGTFLIQRGRIVRPVRNLRFTESIVAAFSRVAAISAERRLVGDPTADPGACLAPAMLIPAFRFTGATH